jgi:hypothetical protein
VGFTLGFDRTGIYFTIYLWSRSYNLTLKWRGQTSMLDYDREDWSEWGKR